jgi:RNA polymerase sigma-70 factor (ECF subfamily)
MTVTEYNKAVDFYADAIYRFALKHLRNEDSAKDIVQETFTKVWIKHLEINAEKVKSYLFTTAYHSIIDWVKKEQRNGDFELLKVPPQQQKLPEFDLQTIIHETLEKLPLIQQSVVLLRDYEGYNYGEIAEITNLSEAQVKVYIFRARQTMKNYIKDLDLVL